jgi:hypothetical protein
MNRDIPNKLIAERLRQAADLLELQDSTKYIVERRSSVVLVASLIGGCTLCPRSMPAKNAG